MPILVQLVLVAIIAYLWGSIAPGYWMGKLLRGKDFDIRDYGSHKIGATNVLRTLGRGPAAVVFLFDLSKGVAPTLLALLVPFLNVNGWGPAIAGVAALLGHCFPIFIGFKGGRGVLTSAGALVIIFHYDNIGRLLSGTERKIGQKVQVEENPASPTNPSSKAQA